MLAHQPRLAKISELPDLDREVCFFDTETTGLNYMTDRPFLLSLGVGPKNFHLRWTNDLADWLNEQLPRAKMLVGFNEKFDMHMVLNGGVKPESLFAPPMFCGMLADSLSYEHHRSYSMENAANRWSAELRSIGFEWAKVDIENDISRFFMIPKSTPNIKKYLHKLPIDLVLPYADRDLTLTRGLFKVLSRDLIRQNLTNIAKIEFECQKVLCRMERRGVPIDWDAQHRAWLEFNEIYAGLDDELTLMAGYRIKSVDSGQQLTDAFRNLGLVIPDAFDKETLKALRHPFAEKILEIRSLKKIIQTFVHGAKKHAYKDAIHTHFNQLRGEDEYGVVTGRLSSSGPNMQQIPKRNGRWAKAVRMMFADKWRDWDSGDWSQFEYRIFAHCTGDRGVIERYRNDPKVDFHQTVADIAGIPRQKAKSVNLGLVFGMGEGRMAKEMGLPYTTYTRNGKQMYQAGPDAQQIFTSYHQRIPGAKRFLSMSDAAAKKNGYVTTILGRRLRFPDGKTHKAGGLVFQGSAADLMKKKLIEMDNALMNEKNGSELILVVHDEFCCLSPRDDDGKTALIMKEIMEDVPELSIPVMADIGTGRDWWGASA